MTRLLLVTDAVGGVWVYSLELAHALQPLGVEVVLCVMGPSPSAQQREEAAGFRLIDTGLPLEWLDTNPREMRRAGEAISNIAHREGADIVQTCNAAILSDAEFSQPCIAVQHSCVTSWWAAVRSTPLPTEFQWRRDLVECGLHRAAAVVAPSNAFAAETARLYDLAVTPVPNGRSDIRFPQIPQGQFVFTASRLWDEGKNLTTLDGAAARLKVPFQAAGPTHGPNGASIQLNALQALGELSSTRLAGLLSAQPIYASAALYEPFGLSVLEAAQAGCALVLSDIPTHREIWSGAAIFAPAQDDAAFATAVDDLLRDPDERQQLGRLARARARFYTPERTARTMAELYAHLADGRARREPMLLGSVA